MIRPTEVIGPKQNPYLLRWVLFRWLKLPRVYIHKFMRSDDDRALHDHPWWFISILLKGQYTEITQNKIIPRKAPSIAFRPLNHRHRILLHIDHEKLMDNPRGSVVKPVWTLFITGPRKRNWGFWCEPERFVPHREFDGCEQ